MLCAAVLSVALVGCIFVDPPPPGEGAGNPGSGKGSSVGGDGGKGDGGAVKGVDCNVPTTFGVTLCQAVNKCPSATVNQGSWMGCGYWVNGSVLDLECECSGFLCPIGSVATCAEASELLLTSSATNVCAAASQGTCKNELFSPDASSSSPNCDQTCLSMCPSGDQTCIEYCGC
jgi:hypothetical protein